LLIISFAPAPHVVNRSVRWSKRWHDYCGCLSLFKIGYSVPIVTIQNYVYIEIKSRFREMLANTQFIVFNFTRYV
jgi:hypothetical protein